MAAGIASAAMMAVFAMGSNQPTLVRAQSNAGDAKPKAEVKPDTSKLLRRHSSGDHAFLPTQQHRDAMRASQKNFGVPHNLVQDGEGNRLPTTRGY